MPSVASDWNCDALRIGWLDQTTQMQMAATVRWTATDSHLRPPAPSMPGARETVMLRPWAAAATTPPATSQGRSTAWIS